MLWPKSHSPAVTSGAGLEKSQISNPEVAAAMAASLEGNNEVRLLGFPKSGAARAVQIYAQPVTATAVFVHASIRWVL